MYQFSVVEGQKDPGSLDPYRSPSVVEQILWYMRRHVVDLVLIAAALLVTATNMFDFLNQPAEGGRTIGTKQVLGAIADPIPKPQSKELTVEMSGAVMFPGVYRVEEGARLNDVIRRSGGYSKEAAVEYVGRNFNLSRFVGDQEKIYVPTRSEIARGIFLEEPRMLSYLLPAVVKGQSSNQSDSTFAQAVVAKGMVSLNKASIPELDSLPNIGPTIAQKIVDGRPYTSVDELLSKKIVKSSVFAQIKQLITL